MHQETFFGNIAIVVEFQIVFHILDFIFCFRYTEFSSLKIQPSRFQMRRRYILSSLRILNAFHSLSAITINFDSPLFYVYVANSFASILTLTKNT